MRPQGIIREDPFPHLYFQYFFTPQTYQTILTHIPKKQECKPLEGPRHKEFRRIYPLDGVSIPFWQKINEQLKSYQLQEFLFSRLNITVSGYPCAAIVRDLPGYSIEPHADAECKVCTVQIFLQGGEMLGTRLLDGPKAKRVKQLGFIPNTGYAFKVTKDSWHDRPPTPLDSGIRDSLILCYFNTPEQEFK